MKNLSPPVQVSPATTLPADLAGLINRCQSDGQAALNEVALCTIARHQSNAAGRAQLAIAREVLRAIGLDLAEAERDAPLAKAGMNLVGISIYRQVTLSGGAETLSPEQIEQLAAMRSMAEASYKALKLALKRAGADPQALDRVVAGAERAEGEAGRDDQAIREVFRTAGIVIRTLGHNKGVYYYQSSKTCEVIDIKADGHKNLNLLQLANLDVWEACFPADLGGANWSAAADWLMEHCHRAGIFDSSKIRGLGAWYDKGRSILHLGNRLVIDGTETKLQDYKGDYIYERGRTLPILADALNNPLTDEEGDSLMAIFQGLRWADPLGGFLMAGWVCSAMICGAMTWRPHAWLTGGSGSGKSWAQTNIVYPLMNGIALFVQSATTEAGLRHSLNADALPVIFDEAEAEDAKAAFRMQAIFELARQASSESGGQIRKGSSGGTAKIYSIRSSFLFSSIVVSLKQQADLNRFTVLNLAPPPAESDAAGLRAAEKSFEGLKRLVADNILPDTSSRLFSRLIHLIPTIVQNVSVFTKASAKVLGSQRMGDQFGVLLANAYALSHADVTTEEQAAEWIEENKPEMQTYTSEAHDTDHERAKRVLMQHQIRAEVEGASPWRTLGELVAIASENLDDPAISSGIAQAALGRIGLKIRGRGLMVHNNLPALQAILQDSPWSNGWNRVLGRLPGAEKREKERFSAGIEGRCLWIPLKSLDIDQDDAADVVGEA